MDALFNMLVVIVVVIGENFSKFLKINKKEKFRKPCKIKALRNFLVEIAGIEPATS